MRPAFRLLISLMPALLLGGCISGTEPTTATATPIDCATLATTYQSPAVAATLTTLPDGLQYRDKVVGTGAIVANGQTLSVHYAGCHTPSGVLFDQNLDVDPTLDFVVGAHQLIPGFEEGVLGMQIGGRRELVLPASLAYGSTGRGSIQPGETIVFTVDAIATR